jgi:plastocyanin
MASVCITKEAISMGKLRFISALAMTMPLALVAILMFSARTTSEESKAPTEVRVDNFTFAPATLSVPVNSTVSWLNKDDVPHIIASNDGLFKSKALDTDDKYSYTFTKVGTYPYYCSIHPKMVGKIVVQ